MVHDSVPPPDMGRVSVAFASETTFIGTLNGSIAFALFRLHF